MWPLLTNPRIFSLLKNPRIFPTGQVTHYNVTTFEKSSYFSHWAGNPLQCDHFWKILVFFPYAGNPLQCDHSRNPFCVLFFLSGRSPGTIWPLAKPFLRFILHRAGHLEQFDHSRNPFRVLFLSGRSLGTIWPLVKPFSRFILHIGQVAWNNLTTRETLFAFYSSYHAGRLEQLDHSRNPFRVLFFIGQVAWNN